MRTKVFGYYRFNLANSVREDNLPKQQRMCRAFTRKNGMKIVGEYIDSTRSSDGFGFMLGELKRTEVKVVIIAEAEALARHPIEREAILLKLKSLGVRVVTAAGDDLTNDPAKEPMREAALRFAHAEAVTAALRTLKAFKMGREMAMERRASARPSVSGDRAAVAA
jgi:DNA invertase Pin-like site-specific DNA recombinase